MTVGDRRGWLTAIAAVALFSTSPVLVRSAAPLHPAHVTFFRLAVASLAVLVVATLRGDEPWHEPRRRRYLGYGLITSLHFLLYIASLSYTTIAHSLALVYSAPIFVSAFAWLLLREPLERRRWLGVVITCGGIAYLAGFEPAMTPTMLLGDLLALGSAVCFALYSVAGRYERSASPLLTYAGHVYGAATLWLLPVALLVPLAQPTWQSASAIIGLALGPLALGHTLYNAALRRLHPTVVNLVATQEVAGGILLGAVLLGETPSGQTLLGVAATLVGVLLVLV
ncbi:MAG: DMT family transporter [Chloroflexi bacterium]|nr:DMT family transporter [Chloroflexota bacterium]